MASRGFLLLRASKADTTQMQKGSYRGQNPLAKTYRSKTVVFAGSTSVVTLSTG